MSWGIANTASEKEKIFAEYADEISALNSCCKIDYDTYSFLFDLGERLFDDMYEQGEKDASKEVLNSKFGCHINE